VSLSYGLVSLVAGWVSHTAVCVWATDGVIMTNLEAMSLVY